ncbi:predicted protein [Naegleria gruberi]|uniref:Predicted protein n=1 Tax=Naegleria gruberi TaxID=5762 RepID=D2VHM3_NAEGR|nr:uncharacterized protein NAEGRDRAFT_49612 [Naegleria gruberi]EFC43705.1 predicted protein [Naegleria gruberi]|eukprot:XP_002676449.1 predicted protein [Naegleria gruberi strain NEG-M]
MEDKPIPTTSNNNQATDDNGENVDVLDSNALFQKMLEQALQQEGSTGGISQTTRTNRPPPQRKHKARPFKRSTTAATTSSSSSNTEEESSQTTITSTPSKTTTEATIAEEESAVDADTITESTTTITTSPPKTTSRPPLKKPALSRPNPSQKRKSDGASSAAPAKKKAAGGKELSKPIDNSIRNTVSLEEAQSRIAEIIDASIVEALSSSKLKERMEAIESLSKSLTEMDKDVMASNADVIVVTLNSKPGWKESNVQNLSKVIEMVMLIVDSCSTLSTGPAVTVIEGLVEKIATAKLKDPCTQCLSKLAEMYSPQFVFNQLYPIIKDHKNPKIAGETLGWMAATIEHFAMQTIDVKSIIDFSKVCLGNAKPPVKTGATEILCSMKKFMGDGLLNYLNDVKPALLDSIKKEFQKFTDAPPTQTKFVRGMNVSTSSKSGEPGSAPSFDDLLPRTDISGKITSKILGELEDKAWKTRLEALEEIKNIITEANKRITPNLNNLIQALKKRMEDANVKILSTTMELYVFIGEAAGSGFEKFSPVILQNLVTKFTHNNKVIRTATYQTLEGLVKSLNMDNIIKYMDKPLNNEKGHPEGRRDALQFIDTYILEVKNKSRDTLQHLAKPLINCLQDPKACTRKLAETVLEKVIRTTGADFIKSFCQDLNNASKSSIIAVISKYENQYQPTAAAQQTVQQVQPVKAEQPPTKPAQQPQTQPAASTLQRSSSSLTIGEMKKQNQSKTVTQPTPVQPVIEDDKSSRKTLVQSSLFKMDFPKPIECPMSPPSTPGKRSISTVKDSVFTTPKKLKFSKLATEELLLSPTTLLTPKKINIVPQSKDVQMSVEQIIRVLTNTKISNFENAMNAMKTLDKHVEYQDMGISMNREQLVYSLSIFFEVAFDSVIIGLSGPRICKIMINTMMGLFESRNFSSLVQKKTLLNLLEVLLRLLLNDKLPTIEYGEKMVAALNTLILRILENCSRTTAYSCLITLLEKSCLDHEKEPTSFTKVLIKCLSKLTKTLEKTIGIIEIGSVLLDIQSFLSSNPPTFFEGKDDSPLRMIKTIIQTLVKLKGNSLRTYLTTLNKVMISHIEHELNVLSLSSSSTNTNTFTSSDSTNSLFESESDQLKEICTLIGNKETTRSGLYKLYKFQVQHPEFKINEFLGTTSFGKIFQEYIIGSVAKIAAHEQSKKVALESTQQTPTITVNHSVNQMPFSSPPEEVRPVLKEIPTTTPATSSLSQNILSRYSSVNSATISQFDTKPKSIEDYRKMRSLSNINGSTYSSALSSTNNIDSLRERFANIKANSATNRYSSSIDLESIKQKYRQLGDKENRPNSTIQQ